MFQESNLPDWENIKLITNDLKNVLDNFKDESLSIPAIKVRLARVIAQMRDEKGMEEMNKKHAMQDPYANIKEMTMELKRKLLYSMGYK
ncbi:MAG: hypothetical protein ACTSVI_02580 [Promethearchaeota archaeon]